MARTELDDFMIRALATRRSQIEARITELKELAELQAEFDAVEAQLKAIDPSIETRAEEAARVEAEQVEEPAEAPTGLWPKLKQLWGA